MRCTIAGGCGAARLQKGERESDSEAEQDEAGARKCDSPLIGCGRGRIVVGKKVLRSGRSMRMKIELNPTHHFIIIIIVVRPS